MQITAYEFPDTSLMQAIIGCFVPSLGDGLMTLVIYWAGWIFFRTPRRILNTRLRVWLFIVALGMVLATLVEWNALYRTGAWDYNEKMIVIPILEVGLWPFLQMAILPLLTVLLVRKSPQ